MRPKDKYTFFDRKVKGYRKGVHSEFCILLLFPPNAFGIFDMAWWGEGGMKFLHGGLSYKHKSLFIFFTPSINDECRS